MTGYVLGMTEVLDPATMGEYLAKVVTSIEKHGGRIQAGGPVAAVLEGDGQPSAAVVIAFPTGAAATAWYGSQEYGEVRPLRHRAGRSNMIVFETTDG